MRGIEVVDRVHAGGHGGFGGIGVADDVGRGARGDEVRAPAAGDGGGPERVGDR